MNSPVDALTPTTQGGRRATRSVGSPTARCIVLDTSVVMTDPLAHLAYEGAEVVIPLTVIDELDRNKTRSDVAGRNARHFLNAVETLRHSQNVALTSPLSLPGGGHLRIEPNGLALDTLIEFHLAADVPDHRIIAAALGLQRSTGNVTVISNDTALRVKATVVGLDAQEHTPGRVGIHSPNRLGYHPIALSPEAVATLAAAKGAHASVSLDALRPEDRAALDGVFENEFVLVPGTALAFRYSNCALRRVNDRPLWGAKPRNPEQAFAMDLLNDDTVPLIALRGHAGTGKSLLAIAAGLEAVIERRTHDQLLILRPMVSVGRQDIGYLPGDVAEKTQPWFDAVVDVLIALSDPHKGKKLTYGEAKKVLQKMIAEGQVVLAPVTFLRGRTFHHTFAILDEAQNMDPGTVKTVITRLGEGSRIVLNGDDAQIDVPFASALTCGLNVAVDAFAGEPEFGQVWFERGERSRLASLAAARM